MSGYNNNQYSSYGGNPYGNDGDAGYGGAGGYGSNPYGSENPYGADYAQQQPASRLDAPVLPHQQSTYSQQTQESSYSQHAGGAPVMAAASVPPVPQGHVEYVQPSHNTLSNPDFLSRVEAVKADIRTLTTHVGQIATLHQQSISSADNAGSSSALESMVTQTQVLNTSIKDQIKYLETDAARSQGNTVKDTQIRQLKTSFTKQLQEYRQEEANYERRYREQIARQYRIVNPEATDSEVQEAMGADWGNEGVFQTAVSIAIPPATMKCVRSKLTRTPAENQPHRHGQHRPRQRARPPQRHPKDRAHDDRAAVSDGRPGLDDRSAGHANPADGTAHRGGQERHRSRQRAVDQRHRARAPRPPAEVVVLRHRRHHPLHHRHRAGRHLRHGSGRNGRRQVINISNVCNQMGGR